tara:strand:- start:115 stop:267 length:153 start_codon:yes stop_codon:yes gene_type:complete
MNNLFQNDLGSTLLSVAVLLGWIGIAFTSLRIILFSIKKILEKVSDLTSK